MVHGRSRQAHAGPSRRRARAAALLALAWLLGLAGCTRVPPGLEPVTGFELERYLGRWYEIARLDHGFERGLSNVRAEYSLREDGGVRVVNRGYDEEAGEWRTATGRAYFVDSPDVAHLKVSFFGPFYGGYVVFALDKDEYEHALVSGPTKSYLWLLARAPEIAPSTERRLLARAKAAGFDTEALIFVRHDDPPPPLPQAH